MNALRRASLLSSEEQRVNDRETRCAQIERRPNTRRFTVLWPLISMQEDFGTILLENTTT
jgi:hypothetical protein